jgi:hypothetical protein
MKRRYSVCCMSLTWDKQGLAQPQSLFFYFMALEFAILFYSYDMSRKDAINSKWC